ncbi:MAG: peptidoglycan-associated lipoprotein Pal [Piscinibacter sp.]|uniref:peptidoglycan-associated lipoprotein Pal n=1 Tax=Piscinibacter sp. TaxID=1903157 RepID=UPI003D0EFB3E
MNTTSKTQLPKIALAAFAAAVLAGCSSVPLDENKAGAPVESRSTAGAGSTAPAQSTVTPVDVAKTDSTALSNLPRVVFFDFDSYVVKDEFRSTVEANAKVLTADRKKKVVIEGHTDERGGREYNLALGQKRAEAVARSLALLGAQSGQMEAVSFGKERPAVQGSDEAAWAKNRRAELVYR